MSGKLYVAERQVEYWTSRAIEDYFLNQGYQCMVHPLTAQSEKHIPADFVFQAGQRLKLFGIQYKALYGPNDHWHLYKSQHHTLRAFPWISYGLSEMRKASDSRNALHLFRVKKPNFRFCAELQLPKAFPYNRWSTFAERLDRCVEGLAFRSMGELMDSFVPALHELVAVAEVERMLDVLILNLDGRRAVRFSSGIRPDINSE